MFTFNFQPDIQPSERDDKGLVLFYCAESDEGPLLVEGTVACQLHVHKDERPGNWLCPVRHLPGITHATLVKLIYYCETVKSSKSKTSDAEFAQDVDPQDLFNLIQAAHQFKISCLMDLTCQTLANKVKDKTFSEILKEFNIQKDFVRMFEVKRLKRLYSGEDIQHVDQRALENITGSTKNLDVECILRQRGRETLINKSLFVDVQYSPSYECHPGVIHRRKLIVDGCVEKLLASENYGELSVDIHLLDIMVNADQELADCISSAAARRLLAIVKSDMGHMAGIQLKCWAVSALSCATYKECGAVIQDEVIPVLVTLLTKLEPLQRVAGVDALTELAMSSSVYIPVIVCNGALENALAILKESCVEREILSRVAEFLAVVCRGYDLPSEKVKVAIAIVDCLFQNDLDNKYHIVQACYALQYLSYKRAVKIGDIMLSKLVHFIRRCKSSAVVGSALGVVGNIARWGKVCEIQFLTGKCNLLECLATVFSTREQKLRKEACQIISNIAARIGISIEDMCGGGLIAPLCSVLEKDESDVKMEAAWAIFNGIYGDNRQIDKYPEWE